MGRSNSKSKDRDSTGDSKIPQQKKTKAELHGQHVTSNISITNEDKNNHSDTEVLLEQYKQLRAEIRLHLRERNRLWVRGIAAIGLISGYSFYQQKGRILLSLIPFLLMILFMLHLNKSMWIQRVSNKVKRIEDNVDVAEFNFESEIGFEGEKEWGWESTVFYAVLIVLVIGIYSVSILAAIYGVTTSNILSRTSFNPMILSLVTYGLLTGCGIVVGVSYISMYRNHKNQIVKS
jgi:hypothetical protein